GAPGLRGRRRPCGAPGQHRPAHVDRWSGRARRPQWSHAMELTHQHDAPTPRLTLLSPEIRPISLGTTALISLFAVEYIAVGTAMPTVARALDGLGLYALAFGATIAASVIGMILGGWWSDNSGPDRKSVVEGKRVA